MHGYRKCAEYGGMNSGKDNCGSLAENRWLWTKGLKVAHTGRQKCRNWKTLNKPREHVHLNTLSITR